VTTLRAEMSTRKVTGGRRRVLFLAPAAVAAALVVITVAPRAPTSTTTAPGAGVLFARAFDSPGTTLSKARLAQSAIAWIGGPTVSKTGETVTVYVSPALPVELGTPQSWADFLAELVHGPEISALRAYIATFDEMQELCGEHALGCYTPDSMVSMGETALGATAAEVVRHEYGHHIAFHRLNSPWPAINWGPKHWASHERVCARATDGTAYPGDEGTRYFLNPGEAWAETYRLLDERKAGVTSSGWPIVDSSFYPDEAAFQDAERDVLQPWSSPRATVYKNRFTSKGKRMWTVPLTTPLDGSAEITVSLPKGGLHEVALVDVARKKVLAVGLWAGRSVKKIATNVCGHRALVLRITQRGAFGPVKVLARVP
jgi:hypothetical protein